MCTYLKRLIYQSVFPVSGAALAMAVVSFAFCVVDNMDSEGREAVTARDEPADKMIESINES